MDEKAELLQQLGYSPEFINAFLKSDTLLATGIVDDNKSTFAAIDIIPEDFKEMVIEKTDAPPSFIINS